MTWLAVRGREEDGGNEEGVRWGKRGGEKRKETKGERKRD